LQIHRQICKFTHQDLRYFLTKYKVRIRLVLQSDRLQVPKTVIILSRFDSPRLHITRNGIAAINRKKPSSSLEWFFSIIDVCLCKRQPIAFAGMEFKS